MGDSSTQTLAILQVLLPVGLWTVFWLWCVNWQKTWPVLAAGARGAVVLLILIGAGVWSRVTPSGCHCLGSVTIPNFWWQLGGVSALACLALFSGWLQGYMNWTPPDYPVEPPATEDHAHAHGHGH